MVISQGHSILRNYSVGRVFFQDLVRNAAKSSEMLRKFRRFVLTHNIHEVLIPAKRTTPNPLQLNVPDFLRCRIFINNDLL